MAQALQLLGAVLILIPFAWVQLRGLSVESVTYLGFNLAGSALLAAAALDARQWGFVLLETVWGVVSAWGLAQQLRRAGS
ncbi:MAG TPA: hypothetical protein VE972_02105 [Conexibacter sp.]|jgi:hypothetical protein|nr:hypothetical protein [Conexibacter sp.]